MLHFVSDSAFLFLQLTLNITDVLEAMFFYLLFTNYVGICGDFVFISKELLQFFAIFTTYARRCVCWAVHVACMMYDVVQRGLSEWK